MIRPEQLVQIARMAHQANNIYRASLGESIESWSEASSATRSSAIDGVQARLSGAVQNPVQAHERWLARKVAEGWTYGPEKDEQKKTHPCCLPYFELPEPQRYKDMLFVAIVDGAAALLDDP